MLFIDGAGINGNIVSSEAISFTVPMIKAGLHQIQVKTPSENASVSLAFTIETKHEIEQVVIGKEYVNIHQSKKFRIQVVNKG